MIDRSIQGNYLQLDEGEFGKTGRIKDAAETALLSVSAEHRLRETKIERWRWDKPEILMSWAPSRKFPSVGKNIRVLVKPEGADAFNCLFESNAWYDERWNADSFTRYWAHFPLGTIPLSNLAAALPPEAGRIRDYVERAYEQVSGNRRILLSQAVRISSDGKAHRVDRPVVLIDGVIDGAAPAPEN